jgi:amidohydrolase
MTAKQTARDTIEASRDTLLALSHRIHANPELAYQEKKACAALVQTMRDGGLMVETPYCGLETSFVARAGSGPLHVAICAEYDALPGIGHACGHNIIASSAAGAGIGLARVADEAGLTVSVIGTPAEEGGGGKIVLLNTGGFEGVHAAMMIHPAPTDVLMPSILASQRVDVRYTGKAAHASSFPQLGINAMDAMTIAQVAIGLLRQSMRSTDRVHGIVTRGGDAPNIIPAHTEATYAVRARTVGELTEIREKAVRCFEAGAVATGATLDVLSTGFPYAEMKSDEAIAAAYKENAEALGRVFPQMSPRAAAAAGSTDMGNVSLALPSIHPMIGIDSFPAVNHQPEFTEHCITEAADRAVIEGAIAMAWTAIDCANDPALRERLLKTSAA